VLSLQVCQLLLQYLRLGKVLGRHVRVDFLAERLVLKSKLVEFRLEHLLFIDGQLQVELDVFGVIKFEDQLIKLVLQFELLGFEGTDDFEELANNLMHYLLSTLAHLLRTLVIRVVRRLIALEPHYVLPQYLHYVVEPFVQLIHLSFGCSAPHFCSQLLFDLCLKLVS